MLRVYNVDVSHTPTKEVCWPELTKEGVPRGGGAHH